MIDLHSHVLPGLDDGPGARDGSLALASAAAAQGTSTLVATPHINDRYSVSPQQLRAAVAELNESLARAGIDLDVLCGAEVAVERLAALSDRDLAGLALNGGPYVLLESPYAPVVMVEHAVYALQRRDWRVLLAHPERSPVFHADPDRLRRLVVAGALCSVTAGSLAGRFGRTVRRFALELLGEGLVHNVASDAHDTSSRPPGLRDGLASAQAAMPGLHQQLAWFTDEIPAAILAGRELPPRPPLAPARRSRRWHPWLPARSA